ncbi:uncharacterized protein LOC108144647 [Drosophila elegans]|uniref:uncharacterized protein LOC108144647 n=1 Tax=Drosophila elegans TaxID=30023 RepID=UPI0007E82528|nr:uncharacterized protein LOC108144647 [Drosophila elegans]
MGCSSSKSVDATADDRKSAKSTTTKMASKKEYPASEAFTIPLDSEENPEMPLNETLRQPPKRIQQMMQEAASSEPPTLEELEDKQQRAEQRRQELMQLKLEIIQKNAQMLMRSPEENPEDKQENPENPD